MINDLILFLLIGLFGSVHCIGFCGPILMALDIRTPRSDLRSRLLFTLRYNAGRILTYSILGALAGMAGAGLVHSLSLAWIQGTVALFAGAFMIFVGLAYLNIIPGRELMEGSNIANRPPIKRFFNAIGEIGRFGEFFEGLLLGLIPCGMVYAALAKVVATGDPVEGWLLMSAFGLGTMIAMLFVGLVNKEILNRRILNTSYLLIVIMGIVTMIRGFIPFPHHLTPNSLTSPTPLGAWVISHGPGFANIMGLLYGIGLLLGLGGIYFTLKELRIRMKRPRKRYLWINEDVCEGCGDCIAKADCLNLRQVETEYGQKVQIHYPSCRQSYACQTADCPSFLVIDLPADIRPRPEKVMMPFMKLDLPEPPKKVYSDRYKILTTGVDSRSVAVANTLLATAAVLEGRSGLSPDAYALSAIGEAVIGYSIISEEFMESPDECETNLILGLDLAAAVKAVNLNGSRPIAVVNAGMITRDRDPLPKLEEERFKEEINRSTRSDSNIYLDAEYLADRLLGDRQMSNLFMLGVAYQAGFIPMRVESLEEAIQQERKAAEERISAFRWGRLYQLDPEAVFKTIEASHWDKEDPKERAMEKLREEEPSATLELEEILSEIGIKERDLQVILYPRIADLILYQDSSYAREYAGFVKMVMRREEEEVKGRHDLTAAVARSLFKLMSYKDEYEVARLHLCKSNQQKLISIFGRSFKTYYNLRPLGLKRKLVLGRWFRLVLHILKALKWMRRYRYNPFGSAPIRREEKTLIIWYRKVIKRILSDLDEDIYPLAINIALAPEKICGYGEIKEGLIKEIRDSVDKDLFIFDCINE